MASETGTPTSSPGGKRGRDPEDDVYVDNLHSHKRYLSEIMASSLNGLTVGDPLSDNLMESPSRSENSYYPRDDTCSQYSPMSEDSDESRSCEASISSCLSQPDSLSTSPVSPHRTQRPLMGIPPPPPPPIPVAASQPRQRGSDSETRFPSSPSDICHSADLRRAALLRSVQMRSQPTSVPSAFDLACGPERGLGEERRWSCMKVPVDDGDCPIEDCPVGGISQPGFVEGKVCMVFGDVSKRC